MMLPRLLYRQLIKLEKLIKNDGYHLWILKIGADQVLILAVLQFLLSWAPSSYYQVEKEKKESFFQV